MGHYVGIDLGTTNSAICAFDGTHTSVLKGPDQSDVTPSAIYVDRRGHRFYGRRAYDMAPANAQNSATLFKRYLGTSMRYSFASTGESLTPEQCCSEILRVLFGYLPADWREDPECATVITVPAAFSQVKRDATLEAAGMAGIGRVALMQEPVAAVMSVMKEHPIDGVFLVYDLGGGTFDVSVAEHIAGKVNLLAQGGKEMCGGRDWDRLLWREVVLPWLRDRFDLPSDVERNPDYRRLRQLALHACEQAKIELSQREEAYVQMDETLISQRDLAGEEIYLDVPVTRSQLTKLIQDLLDITIDLCRQTTQKAGVKASDINRIVFIGGPTMFEPLQEKVMRSLAIDRRGESNPMTAVSEGASVFAESIDWSSELHGRKNDYGHATEADFEIDYEQRTSGTTARVGITHKAGSPFAVELVGERDGWTSGHVSSTGRTVVRVPLASGENVFCLRLFDKRGRTVPLTHDRLSIKRVLATVSAIPSSHSIAIKALDRVGGRAVPVYLVHENERLPKRGSVSLRAGQRLVAGSNSSLVFTLWEGEIADPIEDNRYIGTYRIPGTSFSSGVIATGAEIVCEYEIGESGQLQLGATIPSVGMVFASHNFYSRIEGQLDLDDPSGPMKAASNLQTRIARLQAQSWSAELAGAACELDKVMTGLESEDPETVQQSYDALLDCQRTVARYRQRNLRSARLSDLQGHEATASLYRDQMSEADRELVDGVHDSLRRAIDHDDSTYEAIYHEYRVRLYQALSHSLRFLTEQFRVRASRPGDYVDQAKFRTLKARGQACIENEDVPGLRGVIHEMDLIEKPETTVEYEGMFEDVNVVRG